MYQMIDWFIDWLIYFSQEHTGGGGGVTISLKILRTIRLGGFSHKVNILSNIVIQQKMGSRMLRDELIFTNPSSRMTEMLYWRSLEVFKTKKNPKKFPIKTESNDVPKSHSGTLL